MPGLLIIAHAPLASALREVARHTFPDSPLHLQAFDVTSEMSPEEIEQGAGALLWKVGNPDALILTDVVGGTPCNISKLLAKALNGVDGKRVKVISGVNVPMLWRALGHVDDSIDKLLECAFAGATEGIKIQASTKPQNQAQRTGANDQDASQHQQ